MVNNKNKLFNAILFFLKKGEHPTLGKVKLAKLLFFTDAIAYHTLGHTITGEDYIKLPLGPVPCDYDETIGYMIEEGLIEQKFRPTLKKEQEYYIPKKNADLHFFTKKEIEIMNEVSDIFQHRYTGEVVDLSHKFLPWDAIEIGEIISFELFGLDNDEAMKLRALKEGLSTSDVIKHSKELMKMIKKGKLDVCRNRVKEHKWL